MAKMTEKQRRFADNYIITSNATQAAIDAGYSKRTASVIGTENLRKPNIQEYISKRLEEIHDEAKADQEEVLMYFTKVMRDDEEATKDRLRAGELIGKKYGMFTDKQVVDSNVNAQVNSPLDDILDGLSYEELKALLNE